MSTVSTIEPLEDQYRSSDVKQEEMNANDVHFATCSEFMKKEHNKKFAEVDKCVILDFFQDKILVTFNAWNGIVENMFCNMCKVNFITDTKSHCNETKHVNKMTRDCYELSDGSIVRKFSNIRIVCLVCVRVIKVLKLHQHIESEIHSRNLNICKVSISEIESPHRSGMPASMNPVLVVVTPIQKKKQEEPTDGSVLLEFGNSKLVLTHNSWNGIVENRVTCHICRDKYIMSNAESIREHCNGHKHKIYMRKKVVQPNFIRNITRIRFYCMVCNFIGNPTENQEHLDSEMHEVNLNNARLQASNAVGNAVQVIDCLRYFYKCDSSYNASRKRIYFGCDQKHSATTFKTNSLILANCERIGRDKTFVKDIKTVDSLISFADETDEDNGQCSAAVDGFPRSTEKTMETGILSEMFKRGSVKGSGRSHVVDESVSAASKVEYTNAATEKPNVYNENIYTSDLSAISIESCNLCGLNVPLEFYTEHLMGVYHKRMTQLATTTLQRINNIFNSRTFINKDSVETGIQYCQICNCTLRDEEFIEHSFSDQHKDKLKIISVIEEAVNVLQSSGNSHMSSAHIKESASVECKTVDVKMQNHWSKSGAVDKLRFDQIISMARSEKPQNCVVGCGNVERTECSLMKSNTTDDSSVNRSKDIRGHVNFNDFYPDIGATVIELTRDLATLQIKGKRVHVDMLSFHGVFPGQGKTLWCVFCGMTEDCLDRHLTSENHLNRLRLVKFNGIDLIRHLPAFYVHCALCHAVVAVTELEQHLNSVTHSKKRTSAVVVTKEETWRVDCTVKSKESVSVQPPESDEPGLSETASASNGITDDKKYISDTVERNTDNPILSESVNLDGPLIIELNIAADDTLQVTDTGADETTQRTVSNESKPCSTTNYFCKMCDVEVPSVYKKTDHEKCLRHMVNTQSRTSPATEKLDVASMTNKPGVTAYDVMINEFLQSNAFTIAPSSLEKIEKVFYNYVGRHLKDSRHTQNLETQNLNPDETLNDSAGDCLEQNISNHRIPSNATTGSLNNSIVHAKETTAENSNERTCIVCDIKVQKSRWEEHKKNRKHNSKLKQMMFLKTSVKKAKSLMKKINSIKAKSCARTQSLETDVTHDRALESQTRVHTDDGERNIASTEMKPSSYTGDILADRNIQIPMISQQIIERKTFDRGSDNEMQNVEESQNQSISVNPNVASERKYFHEAPIDALMRHDFISFTVEPRSCPYLCYLCNAKMSSVITIEQHLSGARHTTNLEKLNDYIARSVNIDKYIVNLENSNLSFCMICNVRVNKVNMTSHVQKGRHYQNYTMIFR